MPLLLMVLGITPAYPADDTTETRLDTWLAAGPVLLHLPAYHDVESIGGTTYGLSQLLESGFLKTEGLRPAEGERIGFRHDEYRRWREVSLTDSRLQGVSVPDRKTEVQAWYLAGYLQASRWTETTLEIKTTHPAALYLNGKRVASKSTAETGAGDAGTISHKLELERGHHTVMVKLLVPGGEDFEPHFEATLKTGDAFQEPVAHLRPSQQLSLGHLMNLPEAQGVSISADGTWVAVMMRESVPGENRWENCIELRSFDSGEVKRTWRGGKSITGMNWSQKDHIFSYTTRDGSKGTVWVVNLETGTKRAVLEDVEHLGSHIWGPENRFMLYSVTDRHNDDGTGVSRLDGMHDRYPTWRHRSFIHRLNLESGTRERLTAGLLSTSVNSISPDGRHLIFSRTHVDYSERPFTKQELVKMDLHTFETEQLMKAPWLGSATYAPDGRKLLITGSPNAFGELGRTTDGLANDYDTQAYIYDLESRTPEPFTLEFDPSVGGVNWSHDGRYVYLSTTDQSFNNVYRYDTRNARFEKLDTGVDITSGFSVASNTNRAAYIGHGINDPHKAYTFDLRRDRSRMISFAAEQEYNTVRFGSSKDWRFETENGTEIDGHVYYPPQFDADGKYPVIVYYYGGTTPVTRAYSGRYPKELYASHGYIVYVLQPSGAIGYGQEFSQRHLNDWGKVVSGEIIEGVRSFLDAHPYADAERVGAIGASYGGFMTKLLLTETDLFATGISHAGISNITSYWGDGYWGYLYSSVASANSFPWDSPELYVNQSPVFRADAINTPLLLLHGLSDTNVPPAESMQLYTALKLLGRDVEYVQIEGQDHHILDYGKFMLWKNTILAWFDRYLKDEPAWWEHKYGD